MSEPFEFLIRRFNVDVRYNQRIDHASYLTVFPSRAVLSVRRRLYGAARQEAVAVQLGRLVLGQQFKHSGWRPEYRAKEEWQAATLWAARALISDKLVADAEKGEWTVAGLADEAGVTYRLALVRISDWLGLPIPFFADRPDMEVLA